MSVKKIRKVRIWIGCLLIVFVMITISLFINGYYSERVIVYAKQKAMVKANDLIVSSIDTKVLDLLAHDEILKIEEDNIITNPIILNSVLKEINNNISNEIENNEITIVKLPLGIIFSEVLFASSKVEITFKTRFVGSYKIDFETSVMEYGINNSLFTIKLKVNMQMELLIPLNYQKVDTVISIPLVVQVIKGDVPPGIFYGTDFSN